MWLFSTQVDDNRKLDDSGRFLNPKPGFFLPTTMRPMIPANSIQQGFFLPTTRPMIPANSIHWDFYTSEDVMEDICWLSVLVVSWLLCSFLTCVLLLFICLPCTSCGWVPISALVLLHRVFLLFDKLIKLI